MILVGLWAFVAGTATVHALPALPPGWLANAGGVAMAMLLAGAVLAARRPEGAAGATGAGAMPAARWRVAAWRGVVVAACAGLGLAWSMAQAAVRLADALDPAHEAVPVVLDFAVAGLPQVRERGGLSVDVALLAPGPGFPSRIALDWPDAPPQVEPGQRWRARLHLLRPHGMLNPHGADAEAFLFERGVRARGRVRGDAERLPAVAPGPAVALQRLRHRLRERLYAVLGDAPHGAVIVALAMGDQAGVPRAQWELFNRTGITHLVSISGLHVTMLALVAAWGCAAAWRRAGGAERWPAQWIAAGVALVVAGAYCALAGWGVPARRTFFMLAVIALAHAVRLPAPPSQVLALAAAAVAAIDPWATRSAGFWLSFGAVSMLWLAGAGRWAVAGSAGAASVVGDRQPVRTAIAGRLAAAARSQFAVTLGLAPLLALLFNQVSLVSPLANAVAIPLVGLVVTPCALAALVACALPGMEGVAAVCAAAGHAAFALLVPGLAWLSAAPWASLEVAAAPWYLTLLALAGVALCLMPRGAPHRRAAACLLLPALCYRPPAPQAGGWRMTVLDIGQGGAVLVETAAGAVLYDTGPAGFGGSTDAGARIVRPYLRARGIRALHTLVVSHGDADHAGGLASVMAGTRVATLRASYPPPADALARSGAFLRCDAGQQWTLGGVRFSLLHPAAGDEAGSSRSRNAASCVVRIDGAWHSALLTGDIGHAEERVLTAAGRGPLRADVVTVPHHGSRHASSPGFVAQVAPRHAIAQAGHRNRYHHPHPDAWARWQRSGASLHRTDRDGAIVLRSSRAGLEAERTRDARRRYWHGR